MKMNKRSVQVDMDASRFMIIMLASGAAIAWTMTFFLSDMPKITDRLILANLMVVVSNMTVMVLAITLELPERLERLSQKRLS